MKEYDVKITETLEKTVTVQAESHDAAEEQVRAAYYNSEYILDSENFTGVAFGTTEEREVQKEQADTMNVLLVKPFMYPPSPCTAFRSPLESRSFSPVLVCRKL